MDRCPPHAHDVLAGLLTLIVMSPNAWAAESVGARVDFNQHVRPILSNKCFACHGPDEAERQGGTEGLRLDTAAGAMADLGDGGKAIVPGAPDASRLFERITSVDPQLRMPPAEFGKALSPGEIETLRRWIEQGAEFAAHWAYVAPVRPDLPEVKQTDWPRQPIDRFVLARLEAEGLRPSPETDPAALIRRVTLDLTGLPPTPEEVNAFLVDESPRAYERLVDRLLDSPAYGEHLARLWLDLARYGDSAGYADDPLRTIWGYRDWVIRAFNRNQPFDQFTIEQIAGDLLPEPTMEQLTATAFHRNTLTNSEGGTDDEEFRNVAVVDRVNTTMAVWMGTTMACAQCHSHKYDPILQEEYFQFFAFFNNTADADRKDESPTIDIYTDEQRSERAAWETQVRELTRVTTTPTDSLRAACDEWIACFESPVEWRSEPLQASARDGKDVTVSEDGMITIGQPAPQDVLSISLPADGRDRTFTGLRVEVFPEGRNFVLTRAAARIIPPGPSGVEGRFIRVELPGKEKMVSLAEVQVFSGDENIARRGIASQSSTAFEGPAHLAIDGNTNGDYRAAMSTTHTAVSTNPWWEVDLGEIRRLDRVIVWNRTDAGLHTRLNGSLVKVLDADRKAVWEERIAEAPLTSREFPLTGERPVPFAAAFADFAQDGFNAKDVLAGDSSPEKGWAIAPQQDRPHQLTLIPAQPLLVPGNASLTLSLEQLSKFENHTLRRLRISTTADPRVAQLASYPADIVELLSRAAADRTAAEVDRLTNFYLTIAPELTQQRKQLADLQQRIASQKPYTTIPVLRELPTESRRTTHLQYRGNFLEKGQEVTAGVPAAFPPLSPDSPRNRLTLAHWLVSPENPLTARVTVNRLWEKIFGVGIVRTVEEFGSQGELPTHPELLDWLAVEFVESGWDVKRLLKLLVTSAAYRQSSFVSEELRTRDPENRLLGRGPRIRLTAEMVRDQALQVAALLSPKMYGPPVRPPQPSMGLNAAFGSSTDWETSQGDDRYRRAIYVQWRRSNPYPSMSAFDAPNREVCTLRRDRTNTPLQALVTLNDPVFIEAAQGLSRRIAAYPGTLDDQLEFAFLVCLARPPGAAERERLLGLFRDARRRLGERPAEAEKLATDPLGPVPPGSDPVDLAAWTLVSNVLLNLDEMLMKR